MVVTNSSWVVMSCLRSCLSSTIEAGIEDNYGGMHFLIDGDNIGTEFSHFLLGFYEIRVQGIEASFQFLAMGMGHDD
jgi:hypothetical protein